MKKHDSKDTEEFQVLIVDDIVENLQVLGNILSEKGYNIGYATNGEQALEAAHHTLPDLILLDISMPEMDGFTVCNRLKSDELTQDIPIIFLTARTETDDIVKGFNLGAVDYITKPFNATELLVRVNTHLKLSKSKKIIEEQNKELVQLNASKDKFFSIIAHDLRSPLNGLVGLSDILMKNANKLGEEEIKRFHTLLYQASKQGLNLLENLLDWSRTQTGRINYQPENYDLADIIGDKVNLVKAIAENKNITLTSEVEKKSIAYCDHNMISSVIRNFLTNALKFTPRSGHVTIRASKSNNVWVVEVIDTGIGLTEEEIGKLFKIDVHHTTPGTDNEKGTGLGLILCQEFIIKNGGKLNIESEKFKGSTFSFTLPIGN